MSNLIVTATRVVERATLGRLSRRRASRIDRTVDRYEIAAARAPLKQRAALEQVDYIELAQIYGMQPAAVHALVDAHAITPRGFDDDGRLLILAEPHVFSALTHHAYDRSDPDCSYPEWMRYRPGAAPPPAFLRHPYAMSNTERWALWAQMALLDFAAACGALRVGRFQYPAANWRGVCVTSAYTVVRHAQMGERDQVQILLRFVEANGLVPAVNAMDWRSVARAYNPPGQWEGVADRLAKQFKRRTSLYA